MKHKESLYVFTVELIKVLALLEIKCDESIWVDNKSAVK